MASISHYEKVRGMIANLPEKTGETAAQWIRIAARSPCATDAERTAWLRKQHGLGHFQARLVVREARSDE